MQIDILTLFPNMFRGPFDESIIKRAQNKGFVKITLHNLRNWALDSYGTVDDRPYSGGIGMVLRPEPIAAALKTISQSSAKKPTVIATSAAGKVFTQQKAEELSRKTHLIMICGHYEGIDQRIINHYVDEELSIGDYVLTGGELPAMIMTDTITRLIPGVLNKEDATKFESFASQNSKFSSVNSKLLEAPHYTRPEEFAGHKVPEILLSGNHKKIEEWKQLEALKRTRKNRPDLLQKI